MKDELQKRFSDEQVDEIREITHAEVTYQLLPYRLRFWGVIAALVLFVPIGVTAFVKAESDSHTQAVRQACITSKKNTEALHAIIVRATPTKPRATTENGKPLKYTARQRAEILAARRQLLSVLPKTPPCR